MNGMFSFSELMEQVKQARKAEKRPQCSYCGKHFRSQSTLDLHQEGFCLEKVKQEDPYYISDDVPDKGVVEVEGWERLDQIPEGRYAHSQDKLDNIREDLRCHFCRASFDKKDSIVVKIESEEQRDSPEPTKFKPYHTDFCSFEQQRIDGDRE